MPATAPAIGNTPSEAAGLISAMLDVPEAPPEDQEVAPGTEVETADEPESPEVVAEVEAEPTEDTDDAPDGEPEAEFAIPDDATITVKVDGKSVKVTGKELRAGYSRTADYSAKTQDLARTRETVHAERSALQAEREQMQAGLVQVEAHLASQAPTRPDVSLFDTDPNEFAYQSEMFRRHQEQSASIAAARIDVTRRIAAERDTSYAEGLRREGATLLEKVPEWKDPARAAKDQAAITAYGMSVGFSAAEMNQVDNHRIAVVLLDGMRWRKHLNDQKPLVAVPLKAVTPTLKPGGAVVEGKATRSQQAYERAASTGRVSDAADAILRAGLL